MQAILEQQRSNVIQFPSSKAAAGGGDNTGGLVTVIKQLISSIDTLTGVISGQTKGKITPTPTKDSLNSSLESEVEAGRYQDNQLKLLQQIEKNTRPITAEKVKDKSEEGSLGIGSLLGGLATTIAIVAGTIAGYITAWAKTVKFFVVNIGVGIEKMVVFLSRWFPSLRKILFNIEVTVSLLVDSMKGIFNNVVTKIGSIFTGAINFFKGIFGEGSMIGKVITTIKTAVTGFLEPIIAGFKTISQVSGPIGNAVAAIKGALGGMMEFFGMIGSKLSSFGKLFSAVSGIVTKIAYPLMIIMSVWDTVKGALAGWEEGGFVGAIGGAIKGLFNGLVFGVLDMIKGAISWIAGALGFTAVEKFLDSFSFEDMFSSFVDAVLFIPKKIQEFIMSPIETLKSLGESIMSMFEPIKAVMSTLGDALLFIPKTLFGLINDYIVTPLTEVFKPVTNFFKSIANKVMGFFEDFGIPEMGFSVLGKKFSIGPFYPFKSDSESKGGAKVPAPAAVTVPSSATPAAAVTVPSSATPQVTKTATGAPTSNKVAKSPSVATPTQPSVEKVTQSSAKMSAREEDIQKRMEKTKSLALVQKYDPNAELSQEERDVMLRKGLDPDSAEDRRLRRNYQISQGKISPAVVPSSGEVLRKKSSETAALKEDMKPAPVGNTIVSAPTVNNTTNQTQLIKPPIRNQESSLSSWQRSKYGT